MDPVFLGQTKLSFLTAAILIALWSAGKDAHASIPDAIGSQENQYFKLDWAYDLNEGTGEFTFSLKDDSPYHRVRVEGRKRITSRNQ